MITFEQSNQLIKAVIDTVYTDGVDELVETYHDEDQEVLWGTFRDGEKQFSYTIDLKDGTITY